MLNILSFVLLFLSKGTIFIMLKRFFLKLFLFALLFPIVLVVIFKFVNPPFWGWELSRTLFPPQRVATPVHIQHEVGQFR